MAQRVFPFLPIRKYPVQYLPKCLRVISLVKMDELMRNHIIHERDRQLQKTPIEIQHTIFAARPPPEAQISNDYF